MNATEIQASIARLAAARSDLDVVRSIRRDRGKMAPYTADELATMETIHTRIEAEVEALLAHERILADAEAAAARIDG